MKHYLKILLMTLTGFTATVALADAIPLEASAAAEAQQAALEYQETQQAQANTNSQ